MPNIKCHLQLQLFANIALKVCMKNSLLNCFRGPYCGVLGWVEDGSAEIAVGIRTFWRIGSEIKFGTGAGITWGSTPEAEWEETELKARKLISLVESLSYEID